MRMVRGVGRGTWSWMCVLLPTVVCPLPLPVVFSLIFREIESLVPCSPPKSFNQLVAFASALNLPDPETFLHPCEVRQVWLLSLHPLPRFSSSSSSSSSSSFSFSSRALSTSTDSNSTEQRAGLLFGQRALLTPRLRQILCTPHRLSFLIRNACLELAEATT